ncbi:MAG: hypothetical protein OJF51_003932 [Nitrospira sp.]|jgi:hypothetical protein|nr:MAG: hypothetical protein OJF51_003932 [Nitrospira sp.]
MQRLWLVLVCLVMLVCPQLATSADRPLFILKDSGFQASSQHRLYWLDNDRVIFTGYEINLEKIDKEGRYGREQNIYIWDTRENRRTIYVKNASLGCYFRGYIRYSILNGPSKKGPMGQERTYLDMYYSKETWEGEPPEWGERVRMHPITCQAYQSRGLLRDFVELLPIHGYLDFRRPPDVPPSQPSPILLYRSGSYGPTRLSINDSQVWPPSVRYVEFLDAYVLHAGVNRHSFWILNPNGTLTEHGVPEVRGGWHHFLPLRSGVLAIGGTINVEKLGDIGSRGVYWLEGDRIQKIAAGFINTAAISPDGCKVVFVQETHGSPLTENLTTLHLVDTCKGA